MTDNALMILENGNPKELFVMNGLDAFIAKIKEEVANAPQDISTKKGREEIASLAYKVAKSKTALVKLGKESIEDLQKTVKAVTAERNRGEAALQEIQDNIRKPLTEWENAEKERVAGHEASITNIQLHSEQVSSGWQSLSLEDMTVRLGWLENQCANNWQEFKPRADIEIAKAIESTKAAIAKRTTYDAEQAELKRLREESAIREQKEREAKIAADAAEKARLESATQIEEAEQRAKKAEDDKMAAAAQAEKEKQEAVEAEKKRQAEDAAKIAAETAKREADKEHRAKINNEIVNALMDIDNNLLSPDFCKKIIIAIALGNIPHVKIIY